MPDVKELELNNGVSDRQYEAQGHSAIVTRIPGVARIEEHAEWRLLSRLPMRLTAAVPLATFKVRDLLALRAGQTLLTACASTGDVPLKIGTIQLGWTEFEVVEQQMSVRLTRIA